MRSSALLAAVLLFAVVPSSAADLVTLIGPDGRVALSDAEQAEISTIVKREAESCSISSVGYPEIYRDRDAAATWQTIQRGRHLYIRYERPLVIRRGVGGGSPVVASEVLTGLANPKFPDQPITRHDGVVTMHSKCGGQFGIELMCLPKLRPYFEPKVLENNCAILERMRRSS